MPWWFSENLYLVSLCGVFVGRLLHRPLVAALPQGWQGDPQLLT